MRTRAAMRLGLGGMVLASIGLVGTMFPGLLPGARVQLEKAGLGKYLGAFTPGVSTPIGDGWIRHEYDPDGGEGPLCIAGSPWSAFSRAGDPSKLLIVEQGGGACWQGFYNCNVFLGHNPLPPFPQVDQAGIWNRSNPGNPFADYSVVYLPYCDGSVFSGDNDVPDASFPFGPTRFHRGARNQSAGIDLARNLFPDATRITLAGTSAGGAGVAGLGAFLVRMVFGNQVDLTVFNDAGPVAVNLAAQEAVAARASDWNFGPFFPASCQECDPFGQPTRLIDWRLKNDGAIREAIYETDGDLTNRFFLGLLGDQPGWRNLILTEHGLLNQAYPSRYKRFFVANDTTHGALQTIRFYIQSIDGVALNEWTADFLDDAEGWVDLVEAP